jgi:hypothetical protein
MMVQKMSVAQEPAVETPLATNFQRSQPKEAAPPWVRTWHESLIRLKLGDAEYRDLQYLEN